MKQALVGSSVPLGLTMFGLVVFAVIFVLIILWTFRKGSKKKYQDIASMPLDTEEKHDR